MDSVKDIVASTPLEMADVFSPQTMQVVVPTPLLQESDLFAPVAAGPADAVAELKSVGR